MQETVNILALWIAIAIGLGLIVLMAAGIIFWNRTLRGVIRRQTSQLQKELAERKKTEWQILASVQLFRALVENSPDHIARYDRKFRRIYSNPAIQKLFEDQVEDTLGKTPVNQSPLYAPRVYMDHLRKTIETAAEKAFGRPAAAIIGISLRKPAQDRKPEQNDALLVLIRRAFDEGVANKSELSWDTKIGEPIFETRHAPEKDATANVVSVLSIARDITEMMNSRAPASDWQMCAASSPGTAAAPGRRRGQPRHGLFLFTAPHNAKGEK